MSEGSKRTRKRLMLWFRQVVPNPGAFLTFVVLMGGLELFCTFQEDMIGGNRWSNPLRMTLGVFLAGIAGALVYGGMRAFTHPILQPDYRVWLMNTPWRPGLPLPLGPIQLGFRDALILTFFCLAFWGFCGLSPFYPLILGLLGYMAITLISLLRCGLNGYAFVIAMGAGLTIRLMNAPHYAVAAAMATHLVCHAAVKRSLAGFPWPEIEVGPIGSAAVVAHPNPNGLGWPNDSLRPFNAKELKALSVARIAAISILVGWWVYAVANWLGFVHGALLGLLWIVAQILAISRIGRYLVNIGSPLSIGGRIRTGRLIIRGHDQVFAGPIATLLTAALVTWLIHLFHWPALIAVPIGISAVIAVGLATGPKLAAWRLTGKIRLVDSAYKSANASAAQPNKPFVAPG